MAKEINKKDNKKEEKVAKKAGSGTTMRAELKKVTWPTRKELVNSTIAVIVIVVITAIIVFLLDVVFESVNTYGINRLRTVVSEQVHKDETTTNDAEEVVTNTDAENDAEVTEPVEGETTEGTPAEATTVE